MEHNTTSLQWVTPAAPASMNSRSPAPGASAGGSVGEEGRFANTLAACGAPEAASAASDNKSAEDSTSEADDSTNDKTARSSPPRGKNKPGTGTSVPSEFAWGLPVKPGDFDALPGMPNALDADLSGAHGALMLATVAGGGVPGARGTALASAGALPASATGEAEGLLALALAEDPTGAVMHAALTGATTVTTTGATRGATTVTTSGFIETAGSELGFGSLAGSRAAVDGLVDGGAVGSGQALAMARGGLGAKLAVSDGPLSGTANAGSLLAAAQGSLPSVSAGVAALAGGSDASLAGPRASAGSTAATLAASLAAGNGGTAGAAAGYGLGAALQGGPYGGPGSGLGNGQSDGRSQGNGYGSGAGGGAVGGMALASGNDVGLIDGVGGGVGAGDNVDVAGGLSRSVALNDSSGSFASFWNGAASLGASSASSLGTPGSVAVPVGSHRFGDALADEVRVLVDPALGNGLRAATLKLNPEHLGPVEVRVLVQEQQASIAFTAQHAVAREALEAALPRLRDTLLQQGFVQVNLDVGSQQPNLAQQGFAQGGAAQSEAERGFGAYRTPVTAVDRDLAAQSTSAATRRFAPGSFDGYA